MRLLWVDGDVLTLLGFEVVDADVPDDGLLVVVADVGVADDAEVFADVCVGVADDAADAVVDVGVADDAADAVVDVGDVADAVVDVGVVTAGVGALVCVTLVVFTSQLTLMPDAFAKFFTSIF